jgi:CO dehydrogenase/acetyl-CoA synthase gamma subunit (corrinoid Fe-S protein)
MKMKVNVRKVMKRAVELAKQMIGDWAARMALALRQAWKEVKTVVANEVGAIQLGADETALKIGRNNVTFEYKNKTFTLDVEVKVQQKKKEFDVELVGQRINHTQGTTEIQVTEFIPIGKARIEGDFLIMSKETARRLNVNFRILTDVEMYGGQKATI